MVRPLSLEGSDDLPARRGRVRADPSLNRNQPNAGQRSSCRVGRESEADDRTDWPEPWNERNLRRRCGFNEMIIQAPSRS
jgi:hypothetical protein